MSNLTNSTNTNGTQFQIAEVTGRITSVTFPKARGDNTVFRILCPNIGRTFDAVCDMFCPIRENDTIYAMCMIDAEERLHVMKLPFVQPAIDRDSIIQCFMRALRQGFGIVVRLYNNISQMAGGDDHVISYLSSLAQLWNDTRNADLLLMFNGVEPENVTKLLFWWHKERNLRRLYLFGLTKAEINACRMTCDEIYNRCIDNPYTVPAISIEKCDAIMDRLNKKPGINEQIRGKIVRVIWKNLMEFGWIGTPTRFLSKNFPGIKDHVESLRVHYGMVAELETAYLKFPNKVEVYLSEYVSMMHKRDKITYDTPIDEAITCTDGTVVQRHSAHYTLDTLSTDQRKAIQGALDHTISVITGGAGVGKCLAPETPVLMLDGTIKHIKDIKSGEFVMGPDSKGRKVLSTCSGTDEMFEIIPSKGYSFTCNSPHVLTLKGVEPYLKISKDVAKCHIAYYSEKGIKHRKAFDNEFEAQNFIEALSQDIFDIPLNKFLLRTKDQQKYCYLFHVGVNYPEIALDVDPYLIGYWLGDDSSNISSLYAFQAFKPNVIENNTLHIRSRMFLAELNLLNLINNKHIPAVYKINSRENRLKLLAGFIDSCGHYTHNNTIQIIQKNTKLNDDIEYLAFSLGFMVTRVENVIGSIYKKEIENAVYQQINIFGQGIEQIPSILNSKQFKHTQVKQRAESLTFTTKSKGQGIYNGFELDGDGRFLLGDFLVTHNTRCVEQIVHNLELRGVSYALCSFTGKAVARIREVTKKKNASTMHRLIANSKKNRLDKRSTQFEKDIPLSEYKIVIIDEASMVTEELFYDFIQAYPNVEQYVFIGDVNQLSPIGWGTLFQQIIKSETIPIYKLTTNFRVYTANGERDGIILNANSIISHDPQFPFEFVQTNNFSIIEGPIERVYDIIKGCFASGIKAEQIAILAPYNRCLDVLNRTFQSIYNVGARSITDSRRVIWMINDRVMLTENDQEIGVFNGETGVIRDITQVAILVDFGNSGCHEFLLEPTTQGRYNYSQGSVGGYNYRNKHTDQVMDGDEGEINDERTVKRLTHAFALTVDKSQGSEWDFVIGYIPEFNSGSFLCRNRIYTMFTRTKRAFWGVISDNNAFETAAVRLPAYRCDNLSRRLTALLPNLKPYKLEPILKQLEMVSEDYESMPSDAMDTGIDSDDFD